MTDSYKTSLLILHQILTESGHTHWANWIEKDINLWITKKSVANHLLAYGGMGSINDLSFGDSDTISIWKTRVFEITKMLSWNLAKGTIAKAPLDEKFYGNGFDDIRGWRCTECGHSRIDKSSVEVYLATLFLAKFFVDFINQDKLIEILDLKSILTCDQIPNKRSDIEKMIANANITLTNESSWLWNCPECDSKKVGSYRWHTTDNGENIIESKENLKIDKTKTPAHNNALSKVNHSWWQKFFNSH